MQFGGASADLPHALEHRRHLGCLGSSLIGQQPLLVDQSVERGAGDAPGVALIFDEGVHNRERRAGFTLDQFDRAEQRRRILEMGNIGQEPAHFELGMDAGRHACAVP